MTPELKARWLTALKSGVYKKARKRLRRRNHKGTIVGHCCLGVLGELTNLGEWTLNHQFDLTTVQARNVGLDGYHQVALVSLNDKSSGWNKVVDYIEAWL